MGSTAVETVCVCGSIGNTDGVRFCGADGHYRYWSNDRELTSVTKILRETWPLKPDFARADPAVLEHAKERGIRVDAYMQQYLSDGRLRIPAGEWSEVVHLIQCVIGWWRRNINTELIQVQPILWKDGVAGRPDFLIHTEEPMCADILDLKCAYSLETIYELQMGAYADMLETATGLRVRNIGFLHAHKRFKAGVEYVPVDVKGAVSDWQALYATWQMVRRRMGTKI